MKTILIILLTTILLLWGCDNSSDLGVNISENDYSISKSTENKHEQIPLPDKSQLWMDSVFTVSKEIDGSLGGRIIMEKYYLAEDGDSIIIYADLRIPEGAFQGTKIITMTADDEFAAIHFYPEMVFADTLRLFQHFVGLHLENYSSGTLDFVFIQDDGSFELIKKNGLQVVKPHGIVRVQNAKLLHFSKYGWIRKPEGPINVEPVVDLD
jgi:hypothetical protein